VATERARAALAQSSLRTAIENERRQRENISRTPSTTSVAARKSRTRERAVGKRRGTKQMPIAAADSRRRKMGFRTHGSMMKYSRSGGGGGGGRKNDAESTTNNQIEAAAMMSANSYPGFPSTDDVPFPEFQSRLVPLANAGQPGGKGRSRGRKRRGQTGLGRGRGRGHGRGRRRELTRGKQKGVSVVAPNSKYRLRALKRNAAEARPWRSTADAGFYGTNNKKSSRARRVLKLPAIGRASRASRGGISTEAAPDGMAMNAAANNASENASGRGSAFELTSSRDGDDDGGELEINIEAVESNAPQMPRIKQVFSRSWLNKFDQEFDQLFQNSRETNIFARHNEKTKEEENSPREEVRDVEELEEIARKEKNMELQYKALLHKAPEAVSTKAFHNRVNY